MDTKTVEEFKKSYESFTIMLKTNPKYQNMSKIIHETLPEYKLSVTNIRLHEEHKLPQDTAARLIYILSQYHRNTKLFQNREGLLTRSLFKIIVMAYGYCQGEKSRQNTLRQVITDYYVKEGFATLPPKEEVDDLISLILNHFTQQAKIHLIPVEQYLNKTMAYVEHQVNKNKAVAIDMKYLSYSFRHYKTTCTRHEVAKQKFQILTSHHIDRDKMIRTLPSIYVQGCDAQIVMAFIAITKKLNAILTSQGLAPIYIKSNHDSFYINAQYSYFLVPLIQKSYNTIHDLERPWAITKSQDIPCSNPHCIVH